MGKIIYKPTGQEVTIGSTIQTKEGLNLTFNLNLLSDNPHMFKIIDDSSIKDALKIAKDKYEKSIKYIDLYGNERRSRGNLYIHHDKDKILENGNIVYADGEFGKVIKPLFRTCDSYYIYSGDVFYYINDNDYEIHCDKATDDLNYDYHFGEKYYNENVAKFKFSDEKQKKIHGELHNMYGHDLINTLKSELPKQYYRLVFQQIANNLNPIDWKPKYNYTKYFILKTSDNELVIKSHNSVKYDLVYFSNTVNADIAIKIMGDDIKWVV